MFKSIRKRDGKVASFNLNKITEAIAKAGAATGEFGYDRAENIAEKVARTAEKEIKTRIPSVEQIQDIVEKVLMELCCAAIRMLMATHWVRCLDGLRSCVRWVKTH